MAWERTIRGRKLFHLFAFLKLCYMKTDAFVDEFNGGVRESTC
jgi:hypothetical protein